MIRDAHDPTPSLSPIVRDGWDAFSGPLEGDDISTLYDDTRGLPTVATGCLVASIAAMQSMRWLRPDGSPATPAEEAADRASWEQTLRIILGGFDQPKPKRCRKKRTV